MIRTVLSHASRTLGLIGVLVLITACGGPEGGGHEKVPAGAKSSGGMHATITTDKGDITIEFLPADAPRAVENFRLLAEHDYYNGLTFHRVVRGFMIQGGDPNGDGTGGQSAWGPPFQDEITPTSMLYQEGYVRGVVAMANSGPNTNGSQFFIMHRDYPLPPNYVIFAHVVDGLDTVDKIAAVDVTYVNGEQSKPITPILIQKVTVKP